MRIRNRADQISKTELEKNDDAWKFNNVQNLEYLNQTLDQDKAF